MAIVAILTIGSDRIITGKACIDSLVADGVQVAVLWRDEDTRSELGKNPVLLERWVEKSGLSEARNFLISELLDSKLLSPADILCFADDDGLWPIGMSTKVTSVFSSDIAWALGTYGTSIEDVDRVRFPELNEELSIRQICDRASSLGLYFKVASLMKVGQFQVNLGVGSKLPVAEDTEYAIRAKNILGIAPYRYELFQAHAYSEGRRPDRVSHSLRFLARYMHIHPVLLIPLCSGVIRYAKSLGMSGIGSIFTELITGRKASKSLLWDR